MFPNNEEMLEEKCRILRNFRFALSGFLILMMLALELFLLFYADKGVFDIIQLLTLSLCCGFLSGFSASKISDAYVIYVNNKFNENKKEN